MSINLDMKDRRLLYELDLDCRQSASKIAKKIGLSPLGVNYRIKRLEREGIITQYQLVVNLYKLNIMQFKICLSLQHITSEALDDILQRLKRLQSVKWIASCKGTFDLIIALETDSLANVDALKDETLSMFSGYVLEKSISILIEAQTYNRDFLIDDNSLLKRSRIIMKRDTPFALDDIDIKILRSLSENARKPILDIASELGSTARIIGYRMRQLEREKVILGYKLALNHEMLGIHFHKAFIYLDDATPMRLNPLLGYLQQQRNVTHHVKVLGNWDLEPEFETYSEEEFNTALKDMKDEFHDIIKKVDVITISKEHKFVYF